MNDILRVFTTKDFGRKLKNILTKQKALVAIVAIVIFMIFPNTNFFSFYNIFDMINSASIYLILAFGVTIVLVAKGCDLSIGGVMVVSGITVIKLMNFMPMGFAIIAALFVGALVGAVNGYLSVYQETEPFIITLGMGMMLTGIAQQLTDAHPVAATNPNFMVFGNGMLFNRIPYLVLMVIGVFIITHFILRYTSFGRNCYAIGGDYDVAKYSGINVKRIKAMTYVLSGIIAAFAGILLSSKLNSGNSIYGEQAPLLVHCGVVVGGTSFAGGIGSIPQSAIGLLVFAVLENSMNMLGIDSYIQMMLKGIVIVLIICLDCYGRKRKRDVV